jgi:hypothetical protein
MPIRRAVPGSLINGKFISNRSRRNAAWQTGAIKQYRSEALRTAADWRGKGYKTKVVKGLYGNWVVYIKKV